MYPVHSLLRRYAATAVYIEPGVHIELGDVQQLDPDGWSWVRRRSLLLFELKVVGGSSALVAQKLSKKENEISESIGAEDRRYTLIFGPEEESTEGDKVTRSVRLGVLNGIFRYRSGIVSRLQRTDLKGRPSRKVRLPPGALVENR